MTPGGESLVLRPARAGDAYALWLWANEPATQRASFVRGPIPWSDHVAWLGGRLASDAALVLVAETGEGQPIGSIRFDTDDGWTTARLSYVVAPEARGRSLSRALVTAGVAHVVANRPGVEVRAEVMEDNTPSLAVFRRAGWLETTARPGVALFVLRR